jgi:putative oligomerization/nucleic acid binding protein
MIGGAGYLAGKSAARGQQREYEQDQRLSELEGEQTMAAAPPPPPPPAPAAAPGADLVSRLQELKALQDQGVLTQEEFAAAKSKLLGT